MNYVSTRGATQVNAATAIRLGIAPDGGLFTPNKIPKFNQAKLHELAGLNYQALALAIIQEYLSDFAPAKLAEMIKAAYDYPEKFAAAEITPVTKLSDGQYLLELWHGPTCAFKDLALQLLPHLMVEASKLSGETAEIIILVATSGDTGKAALEGFRDVPGTRVIVFYPEEGVSPIQRLQMVTQLGENTEVVAIKGNFDDAQNAVKQIFTDPELAKTLAKQQMVFSSANSINWGRLVPQIVYYFYGYFELCRQGVLKIGEKLNVTVPTGNFGNILAAYLAKEMGLPLGKLICASNSNNVLSEFINTGIYNRQRDFYTTISPSMDILISSNLERLLYYLVNQKPQVVKELMQELQETGRYQLDQETLARLKQDFDGGFASEDETKQVIRQIYQTEKIVIDPHTAVGVAVYQEYQQATLDPTPNLIASTASPFKFASSVLQAIKKEDAQLEQDEFKLLDELAQLAQMKVPDSLSGLAKQKILHQKICAKTELAQVVGEILGL